jgi:hypothetical protein
MGHAPIPRELLRDEQRCIARTRAGKRCSNPRQTGLRVCHQHGGAAPQCRRKTRRAKAQRAAWAELTGMGLRARASTRYGRQPAADRAAGMVRALAATLGMSERSVRGCLTGEKRCPTWTLERIAWLLGLTMAQAWTADYLAASPGSAES